MLATQLNIILVLTATTTTTITTTKLLAKVLSKAGKVLAADAENNVGIFYCGCIVRLVERLCQLWGIDAKTITKLFATIANNCSCLSVSNFAFSGSDHNNKTNKNSNPDCPQFALHNRF